MKNKFAPKVSVYTLKTNCKQLFAEKRAVRFLCSPSDYFSTFVLTNQLYFN